MQTSLCMGAVLHRGYEVIPASLAADSGSSSEAVGIFLPTAKVGTTSVVFRGLTAVWLTLANILQLSEACALGHRDTVDLKAHVIHSGSHTPLLLSLPPAGGGLSLHMLSVLTCCSVQDVWEFARESRIPPHELSELVGRATAQAAAIGNGGDAIPGVQLRDLLDLAAEAPGPAGEEMQLPGNVRPSRSHGMAVSSLHAAAHCCWPAIVCSCLGVAR